MAHALHVIYCWHKLTPNKPDFVFPLKQERQLLRIKS